MPLAEPRSSSLRVRQNPCRRLRENVPTPTSAKPVITVERFCSSKSGNPRPANAKALQNVGRVPNRCTAAPANGVVTIDGRKTK